MSCWWPFLAKHVACLALSVLWKMSRAVFPWLTGAWHRDILAKDRAELETQPGAAVSRQSRRPEKSTGHKPRSHRADGVE